MTNWRTILSWKVRPEIVSFKDLPNYLEPYQVWKDNDPRGQSTYLYVGNSRLGGVESRYSMHAEGMVNVYTVIGTWTSYSPETVTKGEWRPEEGIHNHIWSYCEPFTLVAEDWRELIKKESSLKFSWKVQEFEVGDKVVPVSKSVWCILGDYQDTLEKSPNWQRALGPRQGYLYVVKLYPSGGGIKVKVNDNSEIIYVCSADNTAGGDYFLAKDLVPYYD